MFDYKNEFGCICWFNLTHVVQAFVAPGDRALKVILSNGAQIYLHSDWQGRRDDVARFHKAMETGVIERVKE